MDFERNERMLNVKFGTLPDMVNNIDSFFDGEIEKHWTEDQMVQKMIKDVDKSDVVTGSVISSPVFGDIPPRMLSSGVKLLICALFQPEYVYVGSKCGDNCMEWLLHIAERHEAESKPELQLCYYHLPGFPQNLKLRVLNSGNVVTDMLSMIIEYDDAKEEMYHEWDVYGSRWR